MSARKKVVSVFVGNTLAGLLTSSRLKNHATSRRDGLK